MKTILILGANGFIGKSLKKKLKKSYNLLCPSKKKLRVENFDEFVGQHAILDEGRLLRRAIEADRVGHLILHGPAGVG